MKRRMSLVVAATMMSPAMAQAGVYIETAERDTRTGQDRPDHVMYIQDGAVRIEQPERGADGDLMVFRDDAMYLIEPAKKTYTVLDRDTMHTVGGIVNDAMGMARKELAKMSPEQRAMIEQMMGEKAGSILGRTGEAPAITVRDTGRLEAVDDRDCRNWEILRDGAVVQELCVVPFGNVPGKEDLAGLAARMSALVKELTGILADIGFDVGGMESLEAVEGYPVRIREFANGKADPVERVLKQWREEQVDPAMFQVPEGYERRDLQREIDKVRP